MYKNYYLTEKGYKVLAENYPTDLNFNKSFNCYRILTKTGLELILDENLSIEILNNEGCFDYKKIKDLNINDICISMLNTMRFSYDKVMEDKKAYLIGVLYSYKITKQNNTFNIPFGSVVDYIGDYLYRYASVLKCKDYYHLEVSKDFLFDNDFSEDYIPNNIFNGNKESQMSFLKGFFDCNSIILNNQIIKDIYSNDLLQQISIMLRNFGVISEIENYDIFISGQEIISFYNIVGTNNAEYEDELLMINLNDSDFYEIENIRNLCEAYIKDIGAKVDLDNFKFTRVNVQKLLDIDIDGYGDKDIRLKIEKLLDYNICYDKIVSIDKIRANSISNLKDDGIILNSFHIKTSL